MSKVSGSEEEIANTEIYDTNNKDRKRTYLDQNTRSTRNFSSFMFKMQQVHVVVYN